MSDETIIVRRPPPPEPPKASAAGPAMAAAESGAEDATIGPGAAPAAGPQGESDAAVPDIGAGAAPAASPVGGDEAPAAPAPPSSPLAERQAAAGAALLDLALEATESAAAGAVAQQAAAAAQPPPIPDEPDDPPPSPSLRAVAPVQRLAREPTRFVLDQAIDVAARVAAQGAEGADPLSLRYRSLPRLGLAAGEVVQARPDAGELTIGAFGLIGPGGVLPRHITATVGMELRKRSTALHAFLDMNARRFIGLHAKAGAKYRPTRNPEPAERVLAAVIGMGTPGLAGRLAPPMPTLLYHAGNLANRNRSAERLRAMLEEETGGRVDIVEFAGGWVRLPEDEQTRLGGGRRGRHGALGRGAAAGSQVWDPQARFIIRIGPLRRAAFEALLPGTPRYRTLVDLARLFVGLDTGFALNLVLAKEEIPPLALGGGVARLGQTSWALAAAPRQRDGVEPMFDAR